MSEKERPEQEGVEAEELRYLVRHPHDGLFGKVFSSGENARVLVEAALPPEVLALLDLESMEPLRTKTHSEALTWRDADLLFQARLKSGCVVLLRVWIEHQSTEDWLMAARVQEYKTRDLAQWLDAQEERPATIPPTLALVVAQCEQPWRAPRRLSELYALPPGDQARLGPFLGEERYALLDLRRSEEDALRALSGPPAAVLALLLMREVRQPRPDVLGVLRRAAPLLRALGLGPDKGGWFVTLVIYSRMTTAVGLEPLRDLAEEIMGEQGAREVSTIGEKLIAEWEAKGRAEGRAEGRVEGLRDLLLEQLGAEVPGLSAEVLARVAQASEADLKRWCLRAGTATSLEDVFREEE